MLLPWQTYSWCQSLILGLFFFFFVSFLLLLLLFSWKNELSTTVMAIFLYWIRVVLSFFLSSFDLDVWAALGVKGWVAAAHGAVLCGMLPVPTLPCSLFLGYECTLSMGPTLLSSLWEKRHSHHRAVQAEPIPSSMVIWTAAATVMAKSYQMTGEKLS